MRVRICPLTVEKAQAVLDVHATPGTHAIRYIECPDLCTMPARAASCPPTH